MPAVYHDDIELLSAEEVERIYRLTDEFLLHRDWVVVPLNCADEGIEIVFPDGKILIRAPRGYPFEPWLEELRTRLAEIDLSRTPRRSEDDPSKHLTGTRGPRFFGTRGYLESHPDLNVFRSEFPVNDGGASMESMKPLRDRVIVERSEAEKKTAGGIVLPDTAKEKPKEGTVVAVGTGRVLENGEIHALEVKTGDRVLFGGFSGSEVKLDGKEYLVLNENEILAVLNK